MEPNIIIYWTDGINPPRTLDITNIPLSGVPPLAPPTNLQVATNVDQEDGTSVFFFWEPTLGATGYNVYVNGEKLNDEPIEDTFYIYEGLPFDSYVAVVTAVASTAESNPSNEVEFTLQPFLPIIVTTGSNIHALDPDTGEELHSFTLQGTVNSISLYLGDAFIVYAGTSNGYLNKLIYNATDGFSREWQVRPYLYTVYEIEVDAEGYVYSSQQIGSNISLTKRDPETGYLYWEKVGGTVANRGFALHRLGIFVFGGGYDTKTIFCIDPATGEETWSVGLLHTDGTSIFSDPPYSPVATETDDLYVAFPGNANGSSDRRLYRYEITEPLSGSLAASNSYYLGTEGRRIYIGTTLLAAARNSYAFSGPVAILEKETLVRINNTLNAWEANSGRSGAYADINDNIYIVNYTTRDFEQYNKDIELQWTNSDLPQVWLMGRFPGRLYKANYLPDTPLNLQAVKTIGAESSQIEVTWTDVFQKQGYTVYLKTGAGDYIKQNETLITDPTYLFEDVGIGTYQVQVTFTKYDTESDPATSDVITIGPPIPQNFSVEVTGDTTALASWDSVSSAAGYNVYVSIDGGVTYVKDNSSLITSTSYTINQTASKVYKAYVVAVEASTESEISTVEEFIFSSVSTNFDEYALDESPIGWSYLWERGNTFGVIKNAADEGISNQFGDKVLKVNSGTEDILGWTAAGIFEDTEILICEYLPTREWNERAGVVRGGGDPNKGYAYSWQGYFGRFDLSRYTGSGWSTIDTGNSFSGNTWYWVRMRVIGNLIQAKRWVRGTPEPSGWELSATDSAYTSGYVGVYTGATRPRYVDYFAVSKGSTIPLPE